MKFSIKFSLPLPKLIAYYLINRYNTIHTVHINKIYSYSFIYMSYDCFLFFPFLWYFISLIFFTLNSFFSFFFFFFFFTCPFFFFFFPFILFCSQKHFDNFCFYHLSIRCINVEILYLNIIACANHVILFQ